MRTDIPLEEIMIADVVTTSPETTIAEPSSRLGERGVSSVVVLEGEAVVLIDELPTTGDGSATAEEEPTIADERTDRTGYDEG